MSGRTLLAAYLLSLMWGFGAVAAPDPTVPAHDVLYLDETASHQPAAVVRTGAVEEDEWIAIGRALRERAPEADTFVVLFRPAGSPDLPEDYATNEEARGRSERWLIGSYTYVGPRAEIRRFDPGQPEERVSQSKIEPREVEVDGLRLIELASHDTPDSPDVTRSAGVSVAAPDLEPATLDAIVQHYTAQFGAPRVLQIMVFDGEPDWPAKPFATPDMGDHPHICYRLARDAERVEDGWKLTPREPEWLVVGEDGTLVPAPAQAARSAD